MRLELKNYRRRGGFTLVEMAIVLVIIGLILAAVSIGKDAQRNAEYKKISQKFVGQWQQAYNQYYERFHAPVGDNVEQPTQRVGGAENACALAAAGTGGLFTACAYGGIDLVTLLTQAGIKLPQGEGAADVNDNDGTDRPTKYVYLDQAGIPHTLVVSFTHARGSHYATGHTNPPVGNLMVLADVVPELATTMDAMFDGIADLNQGTFHCGPNGTSELQANRMTAYAVTNTGESARDEVASTGLTCVWKMTN